MFNDHRYKEIKNYENTVYNSIEKEFENLKEMDGFLNDYKSSNQPKE